MKPQADPPDITWSREGPALVRMLEAQLEGHRRLRACLGREREAIRVADLEALGEACRETQEITSGLSDVEQQRLALLHAMSRRAGCPEGESLGLEAIATGCDEAVAEALRSTAKVLREEVQAARTESSVIATAASALSKHMAGIMQSVHGALSRVGVYERKGRIAVGTQLDYCIDLTS